MAKVNWLWFGNIDQINKSADNPATQAEADTLIGYEAWGPEEIKAVEVDGKTRGSEDFFRTTYQNTLFGGGVSTMKYTVPGSSPVKNTEITGFFRVEYELTLGDGTKRTETGVLIQMKNGDVFFRPALDTVDDWDGIDSLRGVVILSATPFASNFHPSALVSFGPEIFDLPIDPCFAAGTMIRTADGERAVESLSVGDLVWTRDHGLQPIRWRGERELSAGELAAAPRRRPIRIAAGALGAGQPAQDLVVSPQHRILVRSAIATRMFGASEVLVAAKQLLSLPGVEQIADDQGVTYVHLMFDNHEVLMSNGAEAESLYPGPMAIAALGSAAAEEIHAIFPELMDDPEAMPAARPLIPGRRARKLVQRHGANETALAS